MSDYKNDQKRLDEYLKKNHSKEEIGKMYERYIGYLFEMEGHRVTYNGIREKEHDLGIDIFAQIRKEKKIIQCKNWAQGLIIHAKHVHQLYGTTQQYQKENSNYKIKAMFISTIDYSFEAKNAAETLEIELKTIPLRKDYPMIKCNINSKGRLYHLPCDDAKTYDNIQIVANEGEFFVHTVEEAIRLGFESPFKTKKYANSKKAS